MEVFILVNEVPQFQSGILVERVAMDNCTGCLGFSDPIVIFVVSPSCILFVHIGCTPSLPFPQWRYFSSNGFL